MPKKSQKAVELVDGQEHGRRNVADKGVGFEAYNVIPLTTKFEMKPSDIVYKKKSNAFKKICKGVYLVVVPVVSWLQAIKKLKLVPDGQIGLCDNNGTPEFLRPGWYYIPNPLRRITEIRDLNSPNAPILNMTSGILTVLDGYVGIIQDQGRFFLLGPGMHQWNSETVKYVACESVYNETTKKKGVLSVDLVQLGPFTLVTVPPGEVAVTEDNGQLKILDVNEETGQRTHFLHHSKWRYLGRLDTQVQFDELSSAELMSADRVEVDLDSTVRWVIKDPFKAALKGGSDMEEVRNVVHRAARATLSAMVAERKISEGALSAVESHEAEDGHSRTEASSSQLRRCNQEIAALGVELTQIAIVKMKITHEDTRVQIAKIAAIPAKTREMTEMARVNAEAQVVAAEAQAQAKLATAKADAAAHLQRAQAEAQGIRLIAEAQKQAGEMLGGPEETAALLARIVATGEALEKAKATIFFTPENGVTGLMANPNIVKLPKKKNKE